MRRAAAGLRAGRQAGLPAGGTAARWRPWTGWLALVPVLPIAVVARTLPREGGDPRLGVAATMILLTLLPVPVTILVARLHGRPSADDLGLRPPVRPARAVLLALGALVIAAVVTVVAVVAFGTPEDAPDVASRLAADRGRLNGLLVVVLVAVATPVAEELLFRGYLLRALVNWRGFWPAAFISSVAFSATHIGWVPVAVLLPAAVVGVLMCLLYRATGSLYPAMAVHALFNSLGLGPDTPWPPIGAAMVGSAVMTLVVARFLAALLGGREREAEAATG